MPPLVAVVEVVRRIVGRAFFLRRVVLQSMSTFILVGTGASRFLFMRRGLGQAHKGSKEQVLPNEMTLAADHSMWQELQHSLLHAPIFATFVRGFMKPAIYSSCCARLIVSYSRSLREPGMGPQ